MKTNEGMGAGKTTRLDANEWGEDKQNNTTTRWWHRAYAIGAHRRDAASNCKGEGNEWSIHGTAGSSCREALQTSRRGAGWWGRGLPYISEDERGTSCHARSSISHHGRRRKIPAAAVLVTPEVDKMSGHSRRGSGAISTRRGTAGASVPQGSSGLLAVQKRKCGSMASTTGAKELKRGKSRDPPAKGHCQLRIDQ